MEIFRQLVSAIQGPKFHQQDVVEAKAEELRETDRKVKNLAGAKRKIVSLVDKLKGGVNDLEQASNEHDQAMKALPDMSRQIDRLVRTSGHLLLEAKKKEEEQKND